MTKINEKETVTDKKWNDTFTNKNIERSKSLLNVYIQLWLEMKKEF